MSAEEDIILVKASAIHFNHLADLIEYFREHTIDYDETDHRSELTIFRSVGAPEVLETNTTDYTTGTTTYDLGLIMRRGMGVR